MAIAMTALAACSEKISESSETPAERVELAVNLNFPVETKAVNEALHGTINSIQIFIFDADGNVEAYRNLTENVEFKTSVVSGEKMVYALINGLNMQSTKTEDEYLEKTSYLYHNREDNLIMEGSSKLTVTDTDASVTVKVQRKVCKVSLMAVHNQLAMNYRNLDFVLTRAFLLNAVGESPLSISVEDKGYTPDEWLNKRCLYMSEEGLDLVQEVFSPDITLDYNDSFTQKTSFYCYPNLTEEDSFSKTWCARRTRLVVETTLGGETYYYPITLPVLKRNHIYEVTLNVVHPGTDVPDDQYIPVSGTVNILEIDEWGETTEITETI